MFAHLRAVLRRLFGSDFLERLTIDGKLILDSDGLEFVPAGFCFGHGELVHPTDFAEIAGMGANTVRLNARLWGDYGTGFQVDGQDALAPGHISPAYVEMLVWQFKAAKRAGLRTILAMDSNCGQGTGGEVCLGQDFFTDGGAQQRLWFAESAAFLVNRLRGLVDFVEPLVEPRSSNGDRFSTWDLQEQIMLAVLAVDPEMLFIIGGYPAYWMTSMPQAMRPSWITPQSPLFGKIVLTGDMLTDMVCNPEQRTDRIGYAIAARDTWNCPVLIQQIGSQIEDDPDSVQLDAALEELEAAAGGPIGYTVWEFTSVYPLSYGVTSLSKPGDRGSTRVYNRTRQAVLTARMS